MKVAPLRSNLIIFYFILLLFSCHQTSKCINTEGHFECRCGDVDEDGNDDDDEADSNNNNNKNEKPDCRLSCTFEGAEVADGAKVSPRNQPCKICSCTRGVIVCEETKCDCSTWKRGSGRDLCCPQCDPRESCQHQELKHVKFRSGEQWIYQCQTCECLVSLRISEFLFFNNCLYYCFFQTTKSN